MDLIVELNDNDIEILKILLRTQIERINEDQLLLPVDKQMVNQQYKNIFNKLNDIQTLRRQD